MNIIDARKDLASTIATALRAKGFIVTENLSGRLHVDNVYGRLGILNFWGASLQSPLSGGEAFLAGYVELVPRLYGTGRGRYRIDSGTINLKNLVARLNTEGPKARAAAEKAKEVAARDAADVAVLKTLDVPEVPEGETLEVFVYEGLVDIKVSNLKPAVAQAVLAVLKGGV